MSSFSYAEWTWQNPLPHSEEILDIEFINDSTIIAVGHAGKIIRSSNRGDSWDLLEVTGRLNAVHFTNEQVGWIVGSDGGYYDQGNGLIYFTSDGGYTWVLQPDIGTYSLEDIAFIDSEEGWMVGRSGIIFHTTDGGLSWENQYSAIDRRLYNIHIQSDSTIRVGGTRETFFTSFDLGESWHPTEIENLHVISGIHFINDSTGWVTGWGDWGTGAYAQVFHTSDGGASWTKQYGGNGKPFSIFVNDTGEGWVVGQGVSLHTNDGTEWLDFGHISSLGMNTIVIHHSGYGLMAGSGGRIYRTTDTGGSWHPVSSGITRILYDIQFTNKNLGWAVGRQYRKPGIILHTRDGGKSWELQHSDSLRANVAVFFLNERHGWVVGGGHSILSTTNGGETWTEYPIDGLGWLNDVHFADENTGYVVCDGGHIHKSTDGGITWTTIYDNPQQYIRGVHFINADTGFVFYYESQNDNHWYNIIKTEDGGASFRVVANGPDRQLRDMFFPSDEVGYAVGSKNDWPRGGVIWKSVNGGETWTETLDTTVSRLRGVHFSDELNGYTVGESYEWADGRVYRTTDGGSTWPLVYNRTSHDLYSVSMLDSGLCWIAGTGGTIIKYDDGSFTSVLSYEELNQVKDFKLSLYPNPFNSAMMINYALAHDANVSVNIYDLLGRRVWTRELPSQLQGYHELKWAGVDQNGIEVASGVYIVQLSSESWSNSTKVVLLK